MHRLYNSFFVPFAFITLGAVIPQMIRYATDGQFNVNAILLAWGAFITIWCSIMIAFRIIHHRWPG